MLTLGSNDNCLTHLRESSSSPHKGRRVQSSVNAKRLTALLKRPLLCYFHGQMLAYASDIPKRCLEQATRNTNTGK